MGRLGLFLSWEKLSDGDTVPGAHHRVSGLSWCDNCRALDVSGGSGRCCLGQNSGTLSPLHLQSD